MKFLRHLYSIYNYKYIKLSVYRRKWRMNIFKFLHIPLYTKFSYTLDWDSSRGIIKSKRGGVWSASIYLEGGHWMERSNAIRTELHKKVLSSKNSNWQVTRIGMNMWIFLYQSLMNIQKENVWHYASLKTLHLFHMFLVKHE